MGTPVIDIWWSSLETCLNWFTGDIPSPPLIMTPSGGYDWQAAGTGMLSCCISYVDSVADPGFSKWGGAVFVANGGRTSCFQVKSA